LLTGTHGRNGAAGEDDGESVGVVGTITPLVDL